MPDGNLLVVTVANLRSEKGYDVLLECAALIVERRVPIIFAAAGDGALLQRADCRGTEHSIWELDSASSATARTRWS